MHYPDEKVAPGKMEMQSNSTISAMVSWPSLRLYEVAERRLY